MAIVKALIAGTLSDIIVVCNDNVEIKSHKFVLKLYTNLVVDDVKKVLIPYPSTIFGIAHTQLYTDNVPLLPESIYDLWKFAHMCDYLDMVKLFSLAVNRLIGYSCWKNHKQCNEYEAIYTYNKTMPFKNSFKIVNRALQHLSDIVRIAYQNNDKVVLQVLLTTVLDLPRDIQHQIWMGNSFV